MKRYLILLSCFALFVLVAAGCSVSSKLPANITVDWNMTAYLIRADGTVADTFPMEIKGTIKREEDISRLKLDIEVPKNFRYMFQSEDDGDLCIKTL